MKEARKGLGVELTVPEVTGNALLLELGRQMGRSGGLIG